MDTIYYSSSSPLLAITDISNKNVHWFLAGCVEFAGTPKVLMALAWLSSTGGAALTWHQDNEELRLCFQEAVKIPDSRWDVLHIIQHLERAEMLTEIQCGPGDYYNRCQYVKGTKWGQSWQKSSGTTKHFSTTPGSGLTLRARGCLCLPGSPRTKLTLIHSLTWDKDLPFLAVKMACNVCGKLGNTKAISQRGQGALKTLVKMYF